jgi:hypothetical protein
MKNLIRCAALVLSLLSLMTQLAFADEAHLLCQVTHVPYTSSSTEPVRLTVNLAAGYVIYQQGPRAQDAIKYPAQVSPYLISFDSFKLQRDTLVLRFDPPTGGWWSWQCSKSENQL